jgi:hypothetical protein
MTASRNDNISLTSYFTDSQHTHPTKRTPGPVYRIFNAYIVYPIRQSPSPNSIQPVMNHTRSSLVPTNCTEQNESFSHRANPRNKSSQYVYINRIVSHISKTHSAYSHDKTNVELSVFSGESSIQKTWCLHFTYLPHVWRVCKYEVIPNGHGWSRLAQLSSRWKFFVNLNVISVIHQ